MSEVKDIQVWLEDILDEPVDWQINPETVRILNNLRELNLELVIILKLFRMSDFESKLYSGSRMGHYPPIHVHFGQKYHCSTISKTTRIYNEVPD